MDKNVPLWFLFLVIFIMAGLTVVFGSIVNHVLNGGERYGAIGDAAVKVAQFPSTVRSVFHAISNKDTPLIKKDRFSGVNGFYKNNSLQEGVISDPGYLFLTAFDPDAKQSTARLIRLSDQKTLHTWTPDIDAIYSHKKMDTDYVSDVNFVKDRYRLFSPVLNDDGSIVFHNNAGPLVKIDQCSKIVWAIDGVFHHSIESDKEGYYWVPSVQIPTDYGHESVSYEYRDDAITRISPDGKIVLKLSVTRILEENGYRGLLFGVGDYEPDAIHLNDIQPADITTQYWNKGDLLVSSRNLSTVFLYRPETGKVLWLRNGPWLNQHDVNYLDDSRISLFGNDIERAITISALRENRARLVDGHNDVYIYDFENDKISKPYTKMMKDLDIVTLYEGKQRVLDNGDVFIEEQESGRHLRLSKDSLIWEFVNKVDEDNVAIPHWSRYFTHDEVENVLSSLAGGNCS